MEAWKHACMHVCTYVCMYVCLYVCMCVHIYAYIYIYIYICTHVYMHADAPFGFCEVVGCFTAHRGSRGRRQRSSSSSAIPCQTPRGESWPPEFQVQLAFLSTRLADQEPSFDHKSGRRRYCTELQNSLKREMTNARSVVMQVLPGASALDEVRKIRSSSSRGFPAVWRPPRL